MLIRPLNWLVDRVTLHLGYRLSQHTKERDSKQSAGVTIFYGVTDIGSGRCEYFVGILDWIGEPRWEISSHRGN